MNSTNNLELHEKFHTLSSIFHRFFSTLFLLTFFLPLIAISPRHNQTDTLDNESWDKDNSCGEEILMNIY